VLLLALNKLFLYGKLQGKFLLLYCDRFYHYSWINFKFPASVLDCVQKSVVDCLALA